MLLVVHDHVGGPARFLDFDPMGEGYVAFPYSRPSSRPDFFFFFRSSIFPRTTTPGTRLDPISCPAVGGSCLPLPLPTMPAADNKLLVEVSRGNTRTVDDLLRSGASVDGSDQGRPIYVAASHGKQANACMCRKALNPS